jgi:hypothetical protein
MVAEAVAELEPEGQRAARIAGALPARKAWPLLQRRGFALETIETVLGALDENGLEGLG